MDDCIAAFTGAEVGAPVTFMQKSLLIYEDVDSSRKVRRCSVSLGFDCHVPASPNRVRKFHRKAVTTTGSLSLESGVWRSHLFDNLISYREMSGGVVDGVGY